MQIIDQHINFFCSKLKQEKDINPPKQNIEFTPEGTEYFKKKFSNIFSKMKLNIQQRNFDELTNDEMFLSTYK